ncbi:hypothetical protein BDQ12DRAFT_729533 [Crucibulum laeve]|uniref:Uncharacterized protein n=1 Tax=Crucibulum laeve TaxID=68775 RepID=A0A5C3LEE9_9AGAR|nr:hypothetical protein BDQ12DRAFT_729533 [Crucibulum laeve]
MADSNWNQDTRQSHFPSPAVLCTISQLTSWNAVPACGIHKGGLMWISRMISGVLDDFPSSCHLGKPTIPHRILCLLYDSRLSSPIDLRRCLCPDVHSHWEHYSCWCRGFTSLYCNKIVYDTEVDGERRSPSLELLGADSICKARERVVNSMNVERGIVREEQIIASKIGHVGGDDSVLGLVELHSTPTMITSISSSSQSSATSSPSPSPFTPVGFKTHNHRCIVYPQAAWLRPLHGPFSSCMRTLRRHIHMYNCTEKLKFVDHHGIYVSVVKDPWLDFSPAPQAHSLAPELNDDFEEYCASSPDATAEISTSALLEIVQQIYKLPHLRGFIMGMRGMGKGLDDEALDPVGCN